MQYTINKSKLCIYSKADLITDYNSGNFLYVTGPVLTGNTGYWKQNWVIGKWWIPKDPEKLIQIPSAGQSTEFCKHFSWFSQSKLIITEKHNTVIFGENACFKVHIMINVPLLIKIYLGKIQKLWKRPNTEENISTISRFGNYTSRLVWLPSLPLYDLTERDPCGVFIPEKKFWAVKNSVTDIQLVSYKIQQLLLLLLPIIAGIKTLLLSFQDMEEWYPDMELANVKDYPLCCSPPKIKYTARPGFLPV